MDYVDEVIGFLIDRYGAQRLMLFIKNMEMIDIIPPLGSESMH